MAKTNTAKTINPVSYTHLDVYKRQIQYNDGIAVADGGESVSNNEYGSALHQIVHSFLYDTLCTGIDT